MKDLDVQDKKHYFDLGFNKEIDVIAFYNTCEEGRKWVMKGHQAKIDSNV